MKYGYLVLSICVPCNVSQATFDSSWSAHLSKVKSCRLQSVRIVSREMISFFWRIMILLSNSRATIVVVALQVAHCSVTAAGAMIDCDDDFSGDPSVHPPILCKCCTLVSSITIFKVNVSHWTHLYYFIGYASTETLPNLEGLTRSGMCSGRFRTGGISACASTSRRLTFFFPICIELFMSTSNLSENSSETKISVAGSKQLRSDFWSQAAIINWWIGDA